MEGIDPKFIICEAGVTWEFILLFSSFVCLKHSTIRKHFKDITLKIDVLIFIFIHHIFKIKCIELLLFHHAFPEE